MHDTMDKPWAQKPGLERSQDSTNELNDTNHDILEPIAVIGMAVKFPQDAAAIEGFWQMLIKGESARTEIPGSRMNIDAYYNPDGDHRGTMNIKYGHFIQEDLAYFDAGFFSMSPMEAASLDPQQRWLLETSYQALENAGISLEQASGSNTSVHVGEFQHDHEALVRRDHEPQGRFKATGILRSLLANRLSWFYNFTGPSMTIDTACSSGLYALHLSCQALRARECTMGIVAGTNLMYDPQSMLEMASQGFLSPDGICYTFDHRANGYSRGEGIAALVLKPMSLALEHGDVVRAIIRSTAVNQDGRTSAGISQPNSRAQAELIRRTYRIANLEMAQTQYFEAHGTGTALGDVTETKGIADAFRGSERTAPLTVGAVKTNIGHLEATSALAGVVKTILALERGLIPPNVHFEKLNPKIQSEEWGLHFPTSTTSWPNCHLRRASVNSFGIGGSNGHAVLDDAYHYMKDRGLLGRHATRLQTASNQALSTPTSSLPPRTPRQKPLLFVWSAADRDGISRIAQIYQEHLENQKSSDGSIIENLAYTLAEKRSHLQWRSFAIARTLKEVCAGLVQPAIPARNSSQRQVVFVFTGQGAQWHGMGRELLAYETFRASIRAADAILQTVHSKWSLEDEILQDTDPSSVHETTLIPVLCVAIQIAMVDLLREWKLEPSAIVGHSSGEMAAAYCSGALSFEATIKLAFYKGAVIGKLREQESELCGMIAVGLSQVALLEYMDRLYPGNPRHGGLCIACINSPQNVTVSGPRDKLVHLETVLKQNGVLAKILNVDVAHHSEYMTQAAARYEEIVRTEIELGPGLMMRNRPLVLSSVTGQEILNTHFQDATHWARSLVEQVKFSAAVSLLYSSHIPWPSEPNSNAQKPIDCFLEIGPHSALQSSVREIAQDARPGMQLFYHSMLQRGRSAFDTVFQAMGSLHCLGATLDISCLNDYISPNQIQHLVDLPPYPFNRTKKYWDESKLSRNVRFRRFARHDLLGVPVPDWNPIEAKWRNSIVPSLSPWVAGHRVDGMDVCPAASILVMAIEALRQVLHDEPEPTQYLFRGVRFLRAMAAPKGAGAASIETELYLRCPNNQSGRSESWMEFSLYMLDHENWVLCSQGSISVRTDRDAEAPWVDIHPKDHCAEYSSILGQLDRSLDSKLLYSRLSASGLGYALMYQGLEEIQHNAAGMATATIDLDHWKQGAEKKTLDSHIIHPASLDAVFQSIFPAVSNGCQHGLYTLVPTKLDSLIISSRLSSIACRRVRALAETQLEGFKGVKGKVYAWHNDDETRLPCIEASFHLTSTGAGVLNKSPNHLRDDDLACHCIKSKLDVDLLVKDQIEYGCSKDVSVYTPNDEAVVKADALCFSAMERVYARMSMSDSITKSSEMRRYFRWIEHHLGNNSISSSQLSWEMRRVRDEEFRLLVRDVRNSGLEGQLVARAAESLDSLVNGEVTAVDYLLGHPVVEQIYSRGYGVLRVFKQVTKFIDAIAHKDPAMSVLEVGAGLGTLTTHLLRAFASAPEQQPNRYRFSNYHYTDISPAFLATGKESFTHLFQSGRMTFSVFDIEKHPQTQAIGLEKYDLVAAYNVIHATRSVQKSLLNCRRCLKPGGRLLLIEAIRGPCFQLEFVFGLFAGWWRGEEPYREMSPLLSQRQWDAELKIAGFSGIDACFRNHAGDKSPILSAMVTTITAENSSEISKPIPAEGLVVVVDPDFSRQVQLALQIQSACHPFSCRVISSLDFPDGIEGSASFIILVEIDRSLLHGISALNFKRLQKLLATAHSTVWVTGGLSAGPFMGLIDGLHRTYRAENESLAFVTYSLSDGAIEPNTATNILRALHSIQNTPLGASETEYVEQDGLISVCRVVEMPRPWVGERAAIDNHEPQPHRLGESPGRALQLCLRHPGLLNSLYFADDPQIYEPLQDDEFEFAVKYCGVNFRDLLTALGRLEDTVIGGECSGIVTKAGPASGFEVGDPVCAILYSSLRTHARAKGKAARRIPPQLDLKAAASLPIVFCSAYYALVQLARVKPGETVLIHSAAGGLGQATIQIAKMLNAEIFATVSTEDKQQFLRTQYGINPRHIFFSRSLHFATHIKRLTAGRGIDVIVNSLAGEALRASWECIAPFGRFIEMGTKDISAAASLPMSSFRENTTFASFDLVKILRQKPDLAGELLQSVLDLAAVSKISPPTPLRVYGVGELEGALRAMQGGKNMGKILIEMRSDDTVPTLLRSPSPFRLKSEATYLIAGGLGGLGRALARWAVAQGARWLILLSRSGAASPNNARFLSELASTGSNVMAPACDISDWNAVSDVLKQAQHTMPPIKGCIQAAMVLYNFRFDTMTNTIFEAALKPKVRGSWNLHLLLPRDLDFFVLCSSISSVAPAFGQSNYAAGNSFQDALAKFRVHRGEKAVSISIGMLADVGYVADREDLSQQLMARGVNPIYLSDLLKLLEHYCADSLPVLSPSKCHVVIGLKPPSARQSCHTESPHWLQTPLYNHLHHQSQATDTISDPSALREATNTRPEDQLASALRTASSPVRATELVTEAFVAKLARLLIMDPGDLQLCVPALAYGVDSLVAIELREWFRKAVRADVAVFEIQGNISLAELASKAAERSEFVRFSSTISEPGVGRAYPGFLRD